MLKLDSPYFDPVRVRPSRKRETPVQRGILCAQAGCRADASHPAPGRNGSRPIWLCREHIGPYNKAYNFFSGMSERQVREWQKSALWGHRPLGKSKTHKPPIWRDPFEFFNPSDEPNRVRLSPPEIKARARLGLSEAADFAQIQVGFKRLVKRYHPDHNQGRDKAEDKKRLVEIIEAYHYLKTRHQNRRG